MRELIVDRFEGTYCICEDKERNTFALPVADLTEEVAVGDILMIDDENGTVTIDKAATERRREEIRKKENRLFK